MHPVYDAWLERKLVQTPIVLPRARTVTRQWRKCTGGRIMFGELTLTAKPSESFAYTERIAWPTDYPLFNHCVLDGILDGVLIDLRRSPACVAFTLDAIQWHDEDSVPHAYYCAAREAVGHIFAANEPSAPESQDLTS